MAFGAPVVVLFGDSHAAQWFPAVNALARARRWRLVTFVKSACPAARISVYSPPMGRENDACTAWRDTALAQIAALRPAFVVVSSFARYVTRIDGAERRVNAQEWETGYRTTFAALSASARSLVIVRDPPSFAFDVPTCLSRAARTLRHSWAAAPATPDCSTARTLVLDESAHRGAERARVGMMRVSMLDLTDRFCDLRACSPVSDGEIAYRDANHVTARFVERLVPRFAAAFETPTPSARR
jgi:hypothetical protein